MLEQIVAVGDGPIDLSMMGVAASSVRFNAKPKVQMQAPARLNSESILDFLYQLGLTKEEQESLLRW